MEKTNSKEEILSLFRGINKIFKKDFEKRLAKYELTAEQGRLLFYIEHNLSRGNKVRQVDIEKHFQITKSTVHGLVNRMEKRNLIIRKKEGKNQYIEVSDDCKKILNDVCQKRTEVLDEMAADLSEQEIEILINLLSKIYDNHNKGGIKNV